MLPWHLVILGGPWMAWPKLPILQLPLCSMAKVPESNSTPYHMGCVQFLFIPEKQISVCWQLAELFKQDNHIFSMKIKGHLNHLMPSSHSPWLLILECSPCVALHCGQCPPPLSCGNMKSMNFNLCPPPLSRVGCCVFKHPHNPMVGIPLSLMRSRGGD